MSLPPDMSLEVRLPSHPRFLQFVRLIAGEGAMTDFQFNKHVIHHPFCATCGIQSYAYGKGPGGKDMVMINVRCLDGVDADQFKMMKFDGASM